MQYKREVSCLFEDCKSCAIIRERRKIAEFERLYGKQSDVIKYTNEQYQKEFPSHQLLNVGGEEFLSEVERESLLSSKAYCFQCQQRQCSCQTQEIDPFLASLCLSYDVERQREKRAKLGYIVPYPGSDLLVDRTYAVSNIVNSSFLYDICREPGHQDVRHYTLTSVNERLYFSSYGLVEFGFSLSDLRGKEFSEQPYSVSFPYPNYLILSCYLEMEISNDQKIPVSVVIDRNIETRDYDLFASVKVKDELFCLSHSKTSFSVNIPFFTLPSGDKRARQKKTKVYCSDYRRDPVQQFFFKGLIRSLDHSNLVPGISIRYTSRYEVLFTRELFLYENDLFRFYQKFTKLK